jgi:hypothetical protein
MTVSTLINRTGAIKPQKVRRVFTPLWPHVLMCMLAIGWSLAIDVDVRIYAAELVSVVVMLLIRWRGFFTRYPAVMPILGAYFVWVVAICLSDLANATHYFDTFRNVFTPIVGGISLISMLAAIDRNPNSLITFLVITSVSKAFFGEPIYGEKYSDALVNVDAILNNTNLFKVRIEPALTPFLLVIAAWVGRNKASLSALILGLSGIFYLALDARSSAVAFLLAAGIVATIGLRVRPSPKQVAIGLVSLLPFAYAGYIAYVDYTLTYNPGGHNGKQLLLLSDPYNPFQLLLEGRSEWMVMPEAIAEHPIIGWGSWARDTELKYTFLRFEKTGGTNYDLFSYEDDFYIPAHSLIGSTWLWSGLIGLTSMLWLLSSLVRFGKRLSTLQTFCLPILAFFWVVLIWHFFFSPPQVVRTNFHILIASLIVFTSASTSPRSIPRKISV